MIGTDKAEIRERVRKAFVELRKKNILARMNFMCCQSCAGYQLGDDAKKRNAKGWVFWHNQDEDSFQRNHTLFIAFTGVDESGAKPKKANKTVTIGRELYDALKAQGLYVDWNGSKDRRIEVVGYVTNQRRWS